MHTASVHSSPRGSRHVSTQDGGAVRLLEEDPDLGQHLEPAAAAPARRIVVARACRLAKGLWDPTAEPLPAKPHLGLLVLDGLLTRRVVVGGRRSAELLGARDLLRPHQPDADQYAVVSQEAAWRVLEPVRMVVLDQDLVAGVAGLPGVLGEIAGRALQRSRALALQLAITQIPQLERRLDLLLWHLADRWGRREAGVVVLPMRLPQDLLGELVGAQRRSVGPALDRLRSDRTLARRAEGGFVLLGDPPGDLLARARLVGAHERHELLG